MAGIKGITIEIGAKTSSVDRALKGIQESAGAVSRNLNLVKQDLKFEGGNSFAKMSDAAALAAQKVKSCDEKIQVLTKAAQENEKQFKLNGINAKVYAENQAELQKRLNLARREQQLATSVMNDYQKKVDEAKGNVKKFAEESLKLKGEEQAKKIRAISDVLAVLRVKANDAEKEVREVRKAIEENNRAFNNGEKSVKEYREAQEKLSEALSTAKEKQKAANHEVAETASALHKAESPFQRFIAHWKKSDEEIAKAKEKHEAFWANVKANLTARAISAAGHGIINIFKGIGNAIKFATTKAIELGKAGWNHFVETSKWADELLTMSSVTRQSTTDLQRYQYALKFVDGDLNTLTGAMTRNIRAMGNARDASWNTTTAYKRLGISVVDANGELRDSNEVFWEAIDALNKIGNETERDELAMQLFGKSAQELNPIISAGSEEFKKYGAEAERLGLIMDEGTIQRYGAVNDKIEMLGSSFGVLKLKLAEVVLPFFEPFVAKVHEFVDSGQLKDLVDKYMPGLVQGAGGFGQEIVDFMTGDDAKNFVEEWWPKFSGFVKDLPGNLEKADEKFQLVLDSLYKIGWWLDASDATKALINRKKDVESFAKSLQINFGDAKKHIEDYAQTNKLKLSEVYNDWDFHEPRITLHFVEMKRKSQEMSDGLGTSMADAETALTTGAAAIDEKMGEIKTSVSDAKDSVSESAAGIASGLQTGINEAANVDTAKMEAKANHIAGFWESIRNRLIAAFPTGGLFNGQLFENIRVYGNGGGPLANRRLTGRASGGPVTAGVPYIVGERGQELFVPRIDRRILNAQQTQQVIHHYHNTTTNNYVATERDIQANLAVYLDNEKIYDAQQKVAQRRGTSLLQGGGVR